MRLHLWHLLESIAGEEAEGWKWTPVTGNGLIFTCQKGSSHGFATLVKTKPLGTWQMDQTIHLSNSHSHLVTCATFGITSIYSVQLGKLRLIKCKKWGQGLCGSNFSLLLLVLLLQSWGQYKARIQILGHMYMAGSTIVVTLHNHILLIFRYKYNKLRFTIDYSPFCSNFPNPLILPANQPWKQHTLDMVVAVKKQV